MDYILDADPWGTPRIILKGAKREPKAYTENDNVRYIYVLRIDGTAKYPDHPVYKLGTTCNIPQRMKALYKDYQAEMITVLWVSPTAYKFWSAERVEKLFHDQVKETEGWTHIFRDRFLLPEGETEIRVKVRKEYIIEV